MGGDRPKVLVEVEGKSLALHLLSNIQGACERPTIVVGYKGEEVVAQLGSGYQYAWQREQLGTGHAVAVAREILEPLPISTLIVLYGDQPLVTARTVRALALLREETEATIAMGTVTIPDYENENRVFSAWGRVVRDENGEVARIVEAKDASPEDLGIKELSPSFFAFNPGWLWESLSKLKNQNAKKEYYLPDLVGLAIAEGQKVVTVPIEPVEAMGANTLEELEIVARHLGKGRR